jgi:hypothetical protein
MRKLRKFVFTAAAFAAIMFIVTIAPAEAGTMTSGLFVEFTSSGQEMLPDAFGPKLSVATKQMCPDRAGTHTFGPNLRIVNPQGVEITDNFVNFEFTMTLTRRGVQPELAKTARFRVTRTGIRPIQGGKSRINFFMKLGDCVDLVFAPKGDLMLLSKEKLTASLFLTKEPLPQIGVISSVVPDPDPHPTSASLGDVFAYKVSGDTQGAEPRRLCIFWHERDGDWRPFEGEPNVLVKGTFANKRQSGGVSSMPAEVNQVVTDLVALELVLESDSCDDMKRTVLSRAIMPEVVTWER